MHARSSARRAAAFPAAVAGFTLIALAGCASGSSGAAAPPGAKTQKVVPVKPAYVPRAITVAITPATGTTGVAATAPISVTFSRNVPASIRPVLSPPVAGTWSASGARTLVFRPARTWLPAAHETVTVPAFKNAAGDSLAAPVTADFRVRAGSTRALQEILARTGFLPLTFSGTGATNPFATSTGAFAWRYDNVPAGLRALWVPGQDTAMTKGALMAFQSAHNLGVDGVAGPTTWHALLADEAAAKVTDRPYTWVSVQRNTPQRVQVWKAGSFVQSTPANTGVGGAETPLGSYPVYARYASQTMKGTNPDGSKYSDPGVPWINYFYGGDAVHGFARAHYGSPQSNGCVELPIAAAKQVFTTIDYGTVVTVSP